MSAKAGLKRSEGDDDRSRINTMRERFDDFVKRLDEPHTRHKYCTTVLKIRQTKSRTNECSFC